MQVLPSKHLSFLVKHYLFIESTTKDIKKLRLFSDGHAGIVFSFKNRLVSGADTLNLPVSFVYGQIDGFKDILCFDQTSLLIIVLHPHGLNQLLGIPASELINEVIDLRFLFGQSGEEVTNRLLERVKPEERIKIIESFLISISDRIRYDVQPLVLSSIDFIINQGGLTSVEQLARYTGTTRKNIDRKFMESIGIPPKRFSNIIKLNVYLKGIRDRQNDKLTDLAYEVGYYDYSHVFKDFKKITGVTPPEYAGNFNALALNLLEFPKDK